MPVVWTFLGTTTNEVRSTEFEELFGESDLSTVWDIDNFGSNDGIQFRTANERE